MYNKVFKKEGDSDVDLNNFFWYPDYTMVTCTIKAFLIDGQGKFPTESFKTMVIMGSF